MTGTSFGAVTILNAVLCGKGAAFGVDLKTDAEFKLVGRRTIEILNDRSENTDMARMCVQRTFDHIGIDEPDDWDLEISSEIPISRGMKSSSSACNAIIGSILDRMSCRMDDEDLMKLSVECARASGVTVTGALDDVAACHLGGLVITDNDTDTIISKTDVPDVEVFFCIPEQKIRKYVPDVPSAVRKRAEELFLSIENDPWGVMTENGKLISSILEIDDHAADEAIEHGALAAGVTGFGPAIAIVLEMGDSKRFMAESNITPDIITTSRRLSI